MVCLYCKSSKGFIPFKIRFYEPKMNTNLSHICCRRRIVDAQWLGNGYAVCLNMIYNMGTVFQTLLGFGTNHSREHWKLHWKIVSDCVCYSQVSKRCVEACKVALKAFRWNVLFSLMHMQCSFLDPFRVACFIKGHFKRTCFDTCGAILFHSLVLDKLFWNS